MPSKFNWGSPHREGISDLRHISMKPLGSEKIPHQIRGYRKVILSQKPLRFEYRRDEALQEFGVKWMKLKIENEKNKALCALKTEDILSYPPVLFQGRSLIEKNFSLMFCKTAEEAEMQWIEFMKILPMEIGR